VGQESIAWRLTACLLNWRLARKPKELPMTSQPIRSLVSFAVAAALAGGAAWAQTAAQGTTQVPAAADRMAPASKAPAGLPSSKAVPAQARTLSTQDRKFVEIAGEAGAAEVAQARENKS